MSLQKQLHQNWADVGIVWNPDLYEVLDGGYHRKTAVYFPVEDKPDQHSPKFVGLTAFQRPGNHERLLELLSFFLSLPPQEELTILITAMSVGATAYDAIVAAQNMGLYEQHKRVRIIGHDISEKFTTIARAGYYPRVYTNHIPNWDDYFEETEYPEFVKIKDTLTNRLEILDPCDIRKLWERDRQRYDAVIALTMNPCPQNLNAALRANARHMAVHDNRIIAASDSWLGLFPNKGALSYLRTTKYTLSLDP